LRRALRAVHFVVHDTASPELSPLSLHDALPILPGTAMAAAHLGLLLGSVVGLGRFGVAGIDQAADADSVVLLTQADSDQEPAMRSEEHTSELQSRFDLVCRLLLEKKKRDYQSKI